MNILGVIVAIGVISAIVIYLSKRVPGWLKMEISRPLSYMTMTLITIGLMVFITPDAHLLGVGTAFVVATYATLEAMGKIRA